MRTMEGHRTNRSQTDAAVRPQGIDVDNAMIK